MATKSNSEKPLSIGYYRGVDVLRFVCATGVVFHHATLLAKNKGFATHAEAIHRFSGAFFLDVFFIISGFLISQILMKEYESGTFSVKNFYIRRIIRIWPLYFLVVIVKILLFHEDISGNVVKTNVLYASTFTVNFQLLLEKVVKTYTILWSICIEEHIYLIFPLLLLLFNKKFQTISFFLIITGFISWFCFKDIPSKSGFNTSYFISSSYFYYFGIGVFLAYSHKRLLKEGWKKNLFKPIVQILVLCIFFGFVFSLWGGEHNSLLITLIIHGVFGGYLVLVSTQENFILNLKPNLARYAGNISYAMYITHIITINFAINLFKRNNIGFSEITWGWGLPLLALVLCIGLSTLLYYYFEKPILKYKKNFASIGNK